MQMARKHHGALALVACLLAALAAFAFGGASAYAEGDDSWWSGGNGTLTVAAAGSDSVYLADLANAGVVVDVYKIADATPQGGYEAFDYTLTEDFAGLDLVQDSSASAESWQKLADDASKKVTSSMAGMRLNADGVSQLELSGAGLYLVMAHGVDVSPEYGDGVLDSLKARSASCEYTFAPTIVAMPTKYTEDGSPASSATPGEWRTDVTIAMKPEMALRYGNLHIVKTVEGDTTGEPATFVYHLVGSMIGPDGKEKTYENYAAVYYEGGGSGETTVTHIPAGMQLTVTEEYTGARFEFVSSDSTTPTIVADEAVESYFTNKDDGSGRQGYGIENNFELATTGDDKDAWDWSWNEGTPGPWPAGTQSGQ